MFVAVKPLKMCDGFHLVALGKVSAEELMGLFVLGQWHNKFFFTFIDTCCLKNVV